MEDTHQKMIFFSDLKYGCFSPKIGKKKKSGPTTKKKLFLFVFYYPYFDKSFKFLALSGVDGVIAIAWNDREETFSFFMCGIYIIFIKSLLVEWN